MPFPGEFLCAALTHTEYAVNCKLKDKDWADGGLPPGEVSYCSPWVLGTIKSGNIRFKQGTVTPRFTNKVAQKAQGYLDNSGTN